MSDKEYIGTFEFRELYVTLKSIHSVAEATSRSIAEIEQANEYCGTGAAWLIKGICMNGFGTLLFVMKNHINSLPDDLDEKTKLIELYETISSEWEDINVEW